MWGQKLRSFLVVGVELSHESGPGWTVRFTSCTQANQIHCTEQKCQPKSTLVWVCPAVIVSVVAFVGPFAPSVVGLFCSFAHVIKSNKFNQVQWRWYAFACSCFAWYSLFSLGWGLYQCSLYLCVALCILVCTSALDLQPVYQGHQGRYQTRPTK